MGCRAVMGCFLPSNRQRRWFPPGHCCPRQTPPTPPRCGRFRWLPYCNYKVSCRAQSDLVDGLDPHEEEGPLQDLPDDLAEDDPAVHVLVPHNPVLLVVLLHLHANVVDVVGELVDCQFVGRVVEHVVELDQHRCQVPLLGVGDPEGLLLGHLVDLLAGQARLPDDGAHPHVGVDEVDGSVTSRVQHLLERKDVVRSPVLLQVVVLDRSCAQSLGRVLVLLRLQSSVNLIFFALLSLFLLLLPALQLSQGLLLRLVQQVDQSHCLASSGLELLAVFSQDDSETHMLCLLGGEPPDLSGSCKHHLEVLPLPQISNVDESLPSKLAQSELNAGHIGAVVTVASVTLDHHQWDGELIDENALCLRSALLLILFGLFFGLLLFLLLSLLGFGVVLLDHSLGIELLEHVRDVGVVETLSVLLN